MESQSVTTPGKKHDVYALVGDAEKDNPRGIQKLSRTGRGLIKEITSYSLPILSILIFVGILIWGTIPSVRDGILERIERIKQKKAEVEDLDRQIAKLEELKYSEPDIDYDLEIINKIVPSEKTQVALFVTEVDDLAKENDLEKAQFESGEDIIEETNQFRIIPTTSEYIAKFESIQNFLNELYIKDDFIIVQALDMQGAKAREYYASRQKDNDGPDAVDTSLSSSTWTMEVTFAKYQFSNTFTDYTKENLVSIYDEANQNTIDFIRDRYGAYCSQSVLLGLSNLPLLHLLAREHISSPPNELVLLASSLQP